MLEKNVNNHYRGLHIAVIDPARAKLVFCRVFDTYKSSDEFVDFIDNQDYITNGDIIVAACKDECVNRLNPHCRRWFEDLGSKLIWHLQYRDSFVFIATFTKPDEDAKPVLEKRGPAELSVA